MIDILNTVVCYNNADEIVTYAKKIASLDCHENVALAVIINDSKTNAKELESRLAEINVTFLVVDAKENLGYLPGMVKAAEVFIENTHHDIKWIVMSNTDISYPDRQFFLKFQSKEYDSNVWSIGPSVFVPYKNAYDNPVAFERRSLKKVNKLIFIFSIPGLRILYQLLSNVKTRLCKTQECESSFVYEVHGCYFIIKRELFDEITKRPYKAFMYSEEAYISEMVYQNNKKAFFDTDLRIEHLEHSVTSTLKLKRIAKLIAESMKFIKAEFYSKDKK